ncbi:MAG: hypothetical protein GQ475_07460 [Methylococcaceae bacterium]|nr:hypothetical protein [Methylococcaceae bacterium]
MAITANDTQITQVVEALFGGLQAGSDIMTLLQATVDSSSVVGMTDQLLTLNSASFSDDATLASTLVANLGVTAASTSAEVVTAAETFVTEQLAAAPDARGSVVVALVEFFSTLESDATFGAAATAFNAAVAASEAYSIDDANTAVNDPNAVAGEAFVLTTGTDVFEPSTGDDTITATDLTLTAGDLIVDVSTTDNDTMNIALAADTAVAATITNVENINVDVNYFTGDTTTFDATSVTGANITLSSSKLGYNGIAGVTAAAANTVTAGTGVTALTVIGLTTGTVNAGSATTVAVTGTASSAATIVVNGDVALAVTTADTYTINATAASVVDITAIVAASTITVTGANDVTLIGDLDGQTIVNNLTAGTLTAQIDTAGAADVSGVAADVVDVNVNLGSAALTVAEAANVTLSVDQTDVTVTGPSATTGTATVTTAIDQTSITFAALNTVALNVTAAATIGTLVTAGTDVTVDAAAATTVSILTATADAVTVTGAGAVTITDGVVTSLDASASTGAFTYTSNSGATTETITGSATAANSITTGNLADVIGYTGGAGVDTVTAALMTTGTLAAELGAGNDIVNFGAIIAAGGVVAIDGGTGTDAINLATGIDYSAAGTWAVNNVEKLTVTDTDSGGSIGQTAIVTSTQAESFTSLSISAALLDAAEQDDTLILTVTGDAATIDLSTLVVADATAISTVINGQAATAETIIGTNADDVISGGTIATAGDTITTGAGSDQITVASTGAILSSITDFTSAATGDSDTLNTTVTAVVAVAAIDVTGVVTGDTGSLTASTDANGILTLSGLSADTGAVDTLAEWVAVAGVVSTASTANVLAFEFDGNTYVYEDSGLAAATTEALTVELTGVTGITGISTTAAANVIDIM